jgi:hypothetical protein
VLIPFPVLGASRRKDSARSGSLTSLWQAIDFKYFNLTLAQPLLICVGLPYCATTLLMVEASFWHVICKCEVQPEVNPIPIVTREFRSFGLGHLGKFINRSY